MSSGLIIAVDFDLAEEVGTNAAVVHQQISWWIAHGRARDNHQDGWYTSSVAELATICPFSESAVKRAIAKLEEYGKLERRKFHSGRGDHTLSYRPVRTSSSSDLTKTSNARTEPSNRLDENVKSRLDENVKSSTSREKITPLPPTAEPGAAASSDSGGDGGAAGREDPMLLATREVRDQAGLRPAHDQKMIEAVTAALRAGHQLAALKDLATKARDGDRPRSYLLASLKNLGAPSVRAVGGPLAGLTTFEDHPVADDLRADAEYWARVGENPGSLPVATVPKRATVKVPHKEDEETT